MDEEDFGEIVELIRQQLALIGVAEVGFPEPYRAEEDFRPTNRDLALQMLKAFDRHLSVLHPAMFVNALNRLGSVIKQPPTTLTPVVTTDADGPLRLVPDPRIAEVQDMLRRLIDDLSQDRTHEPPQGRTL